MINTLLALTKGETSGNYNAFTHSNYYCAMGILQDLWINNHALQEEETTFFDNGQELLLYTNLGTYSCNYTEYCNIKFITSVYSNNGLVLEYPFDYESDTSRLPMPKKRKYTLNFAVTSKNNLDPDLMEKYFDKEKCIVKITPIHETVEAIDEGYEIVTDFDVYEKFEQPLVDRGWDVIVFVPSKEEDEDRITCGNSLIALANTK